MLDSPWGKVQQSYQLELGVSWVSTAGHGGLMCSRAVGESKLSPRARLCVSSRFGGYFCFEEDCDYAVALFDVPVWAHLMAARDAADWKKYLGQSAFGLPAAEIQKRYDEKIAHAQESDDQTRKRLRFDVLYWNPEYFGLGGCQRESGPGTFGLSCVKRDVKPAEMCEPCLKTQQAVNAARLLEDFREKVPA